MMTHSHVRASSRPSRTGASWPTPDGAFKEPCGDLGGASAQLALNLLCIVTAVVATLSLRARSFGASVALANAPADADVNGGRRSQHRQLNVEPLWSPAVATRGNRSQTAQPVGCANSVLPANRPFLASGRVCAPHAELMASPGSVEQTP